MNVGELEGDTQAEKMKEIDGIEMDVENLQTITFNYETTWVNKVIMNTSVTSMDPIKRVKRKKEVNTTIILE